jgi:nitroreductase
MNVSEAIRLKRATREFSDKPIIEATIQTILNAGRRAQSSKNLQPWHFIAITDKGILQALSECGQDMGNGRFNTWHLAEAALGIAIVHPDPDERFQTLFDIGQAAAYMQLAAWELGVGSCPVTFYQPEKGRQILGFPPDLHLRLGLSLGYPSDRDQFKQQPQKGGRRSLQDIVHRDRW